MPAVLPEEMPPRDGRETTGERLVRIETLMQTVLSSLHAHIRSEEKEFVEMKDSLKEHLNGTALMARDLQQLASDVKSMRTQVDKLEAEVKVLSRSRAQAIAWAAGVSATVSALWIVAGPKLASVFGISG